MSSWAIDCTKIIFRRPERKVFQTAGILLHPGGVKLWMKYFTAQQKRGVWMFKCSCSQEQGRFIG